MDSAVFGLDQRDRHFDLWSKAEPKNTRHTSAVHIPPAEYDQDRLPSSLPSLPGTGQEAGLPELL